MSKIFWIIYWTDSNLLLIELIFTCPKNKLLGCLDFVFFKKEKRRFSKFVWLFYLYLSKYLEILEFDSVSGLSLSKASFSLEFLRQVSLFRANKKL